jgi:hypothetical protein
MSRASGPRVAALAVAVAAACGGGSGGTSGTPGGDPCAGAASCDQQTAGAAHVASGSTASGFRSVVSDAGGSAEFEWTVTGARTAVRYRPPGGTFGPALEIDAAPAGAAGVSRASLFLHRDAVAATAAVARRGLRAALLGGPGASASFTGTGVENEAGCNTIHVFDCSRKGACCDVHDACISEHCAGQGDCGNLGAALVAGYTSQPCSPACLQCHGAAARCFLDDGEPGESRCCADGDCGRRQQCIVDDVVITDPCVCQANQLVGRDVCPGTCVRPGLPWTASPAECCNGGLTAGQSCATQSVCCISDGSPCTRDEECCGFSAYLFSGAGPLPSCGLGAGQCLLHVTSGACVAGVCRGGVVCNYLCADGPVFCPAS